MINKEVLLVSENYVKTRGLISDNMSGDSLTPVILTAQQIGLQSILGTKLYEKINELVFDSTIDEVTNVLYKELLDVHIQPYLLYTVMADIQIPLYARFMNAGMVQHSDDSYSNIGLKDIGFIVTEYKNKAAFYSDRITKFLMANCTNIVEYKSTDDVSDLKSTEANYNCPIFLG